jgi:hypothetical protein
MEAVFFIFWNALGAIGRLIAVPRSARAMPNRRMHPNEKPNLFHNFCSTKKLPPDVPCAKAFSRRAKKYHCTKADF